MAKNFVCVPFDAMDDDQLWEFANGWSALVASADNHDFELDFPSLAGHYGVDPETAFLRLQDRRQAHRNGERMQFALHADGQAAGLSTIAPNALRPGRVPD